jgi:hypothetical protein
VARAGGGGRSGQGRAHGELGIDAAGAKRKWGAGLLAGIDRIWQTCYDVFYGHDLDEHFASGGPARVR